MSYKKDLEKKQKKVDDLRNNLKKGMLSEEKAKHDIVEQVIHTLSVNKIPSYLFVDLPNPEYDDLEMPCIFQFNNITSIYDIETEDGVENISNFNETLWVHMFNMVLDSPGAKHSGMDKLDKNDPNTLKEHLRYFSYFMHLCLYNQTQKRKKED